MENNIKVAIRVRRLIDREVQNKDAIHWGTSDSTIYEVDPSTSQTIPGGTTATFDHIFDASCSTWNIFQEIAAPIVRSAMHGFHGTIFAYGQTASGKTYTILGPDGLIENPAATEDEVPIDEYGILPCAIMEVYEAIEGSVDREFLVRVSYMQIYNEKIQDLLTGEDGLKIREKPNGDVYVEGLKEELVTDAADIVEAIRLGQEHRRTGETQMNKSSSRSHTIFRIIIESRQRQTTDGTGVDTEASGDGVVTVSHLNIVDLAGSERASQTGAVGLRLKEAGHINKSLSILSRVISQLAAVSETGNQSAHINYRDCCLTRILQNALGGNAKTAVVCTVTPAVKEETISTLKFAKNAKNVKNKPRVNEVLTDEAMLRRCKSIIVKLREQVQGLEGESVLALQSEKDQLMQELAKREQEIAALNKFIVISTRTTPALSPVLDDRARMLRRETWCPGLMNSPHFPAGRKRALREREESASTIAAARATASAILTPAPKRRRSRPRLSTLDETFESQEQPVDVAQTQFKLNDLEARYADLEAENRALNERVADLQADQHQEQADHQSNASENQEQVAELRGMLAARDAMITELRREQESSAAELAQLRETVRRYEEEKAATASSLAQSRLDMQALSQTVEQSATVIGKLQVDKAILETTLEDTNNGVSELRSHLAQLESSLALEQEQHNVTKDKLFSVSFSTVSDPPLSAATTDRSVVMGDSFAQLTAAPSTAQTATQTDELESPKDVLEDSEAVVLLNDVEVSVDSAVKDSKETSDLLKQKDAAIDQLTKECEDLQCELEMGQQEEKSLKKQYAELEEQYNRLLDQKLDLQERYDESRAEAHEMQSFLVHEAEINLDEARKRRRSVHPSSSQSPRTPRSASRLLTVSTQQSAAAKRHARLEELEGEVAKLRREAENAKRDASDFEYMMTEERARGQKRCQELQRRVAELEEAASQCQEQEKEDGPEAAGSEDVQSVTEAVEDQVVSEMSKEAAETPTDETTEARAGETQEEETEAATEETETADRPTPTSGKPVDGDVLAGDALEVEKLRAKNAVLSTELALLKAELCALSAHVDSKPTATLPLPEANPLIRFSIDARSPNAPETPTHDDTVNLLSSAFPVPPQSEIVPPVMLTTVPFDASVAMDETLPCPPTATRHVGANQSVAMDETAVVSPRRDASAMEETQCRGSDSVFASPQLPHPADMTTLSDMNFSAFVAAATGGRSDTVATADIFGDSVLTSGDFFPTAPFSNSSSVLASIPPPPPAIPSVEHGSVLLRDEIEQREQKDAEHVTRLEEETEQLKKHVTSLEDSLKDRDATIQNLTNQCSVLQSQTDQLLANIPSETRTTATSVSALEPDTTTEELQTSFHVVNQSALAQSQERENELESALQEAKHQQEELSSALRESNVEREVQEEKLRELEAVLVSKEKAIEDAGAELVELKSASEAEINIYKAQVESQTNVTTAMQKALTSVQEEADQLRADCELAKQNELLSRVEAKSLRLRIESTQSELQSMQQELTRFREDATDQAESFRSVLASLSEELLQTTRAVKETHISAQQSWESQRTELEAEIQRGKDELQACEEELADYIKIVDNVGDNLDAERKTRLKLEKELAAAVAKRRRSTTGSGSAPHHTDELKHLQLDNKQLQQRVQNLESALMQAQTTTEAAASRERESQARLRELESQVAETTEALVSSQNTAHAMHNRNERCLQLEQKVAELERELGQQTLRYQARVNESNQKIESYRESVRALKTKLREADAAEGTVTLRNHSQSSANISRSNNSIMAEAKQVVELQTELDKTKKERQQLDDRLRTMSSKYTQLKQYAIELKRQLPRTKANGDDIIEVITLGGNSNKENEPNSTK